MNKNISLIFSLVAVLAIVMVYSFNNKSNALHKTSYSKNMGFAVVELFTSEGCSSCPPADKVVAKLLSKQLENVYILCFHVDYWNRLGWNDPFSQAAFSARQKKYSTYLSLDGVYTPQLVINGILEFVGSNAGKLNAVVENSLRNGEQSGLSIEAKEKDNTITVYYTLNGAEPVFLNLALVQPEASTVIRSGENNGKTLNHVNIVRALDIIDVKGKGYLTIDIPKEIEEIPLKLVAFTQSKQSFKILGADSKNL